MLPVTAVGTCSACCVGCVVVANTEGSPASPACAAHDAQLCWTVRQLCRAVVLSCYAGLDIVLGCTAVSQETVLRSVIGRNRGCREVTDLAMGQMETAAGNIPHPTYLTSHLSALPLHAFRTPIYTLDSSDVRG